VSLYLTYYFGISFKVKLPRFLGGIKRSVKIIFDKNEMVTTSGSSRGLDGRGTDG